MAVSVVEYWSGSAWVQANTNAGKSAAVRIEIADKLGNPRRANITVLNPSKNPFSTTTAADRYGPLTDKFEDFTPVRIIETVSKVVLFSGKVYLSTKEYDKTWGQVIKVLAKDNLAELADIPTDDKVKPIISDGTVDKRSEVIQKIIRDSASSPHSSSLMISTDNLVTDDTQKFETSARSFPTISSTVLAQQFDVSSMSKQGLKVIAELAKNDPHESSSPSKDFGYDYYVDTQYALGASNPAQDLNYFKRGTRTTFEGTATNFKGLTVEYPTATSNFRSLTAAQKGLKVAMLPEYDFNKPPKDLYTGAIVALSNEIKDATGASTPFNTSLEFEILEGTPSGDFIHGDPTVSTSAWETLKFARVGDASSDAKDFADYLWKFGVNTDTSARINDGSGINASVTTITVDGSHSIKAGDIIMIDTENMYVTESSATSLTVIRGWGSTHGSYSAAASHDDDDIIYTHPIVGRIQYQSMSSSAGYILISFEKDTSSNSEINTQKKEFESIATGGSEITLTNGNQTFAFTPSTGRPKINYGLQRPLRITGNDVKSLDSVRERIASTLARTKGTRTDCVIGTLPPPFTYLQTGVASVTSATIVVLDDNAFNYGARVGMTIAKVDATGTQTDYGYITAISGATVTAALDTGNWTGYDGDIRVYIPVRAGHYIRANNFLVNFEGYMFAQEVTYTEQAGAQLTTYKGTGVNTAGTNSLGLGIDPNAIVAAIEGEAQKVPRVTNVPMGGLGWTFRPTSATDTASFSSTDRDTIAWTGGELIIGAMKKYKIVAGNSGNMSTTADSSTTFPYLHKIVFDPDQTPDVNGAYTFKVFTEQAGVTSGITTFYPDMDYIILGHCRSAKESTGLATLIFDGTGQGMFGGRSGTGEDAFTSALFKKSIQPYTTTMNLFVGNSSEANKQRYIHATAGVAGTTTNGTISFADNTTIAIEFNNSLDLGTVDNTTYYIFFKLVDSSNNETADFVDVDAAEVERTTDYNDATSDSRGLLAICGTGADASTDEIAIQAFHGKGQNINADAIAANAITANAIKTGSLDSHVITLTGDGRFVTAAGLDRVGTDHWTSGSGGILIDQYGILGTSAANTDISSTEFYLQASDGKALFGGGKVIADSSGLTFTDGLDNQTATSGSNLTWTAPDKAIAFITRVQSDSGVHTKGDTIVNLGDRCHFVNDMVGGSLNTTEIGANESGWFNNIYTERVSFESNNSVYEEFATIEAPTDYAGSDSGTARYTIVLPTSAGLVGEVLSITALSGSTMTTDWQAGTTGITAVGALNAGSIAAGFGAIDVGSDSITTSGSIVFGNLSDTSITITAFADEDDMTSNSDSKLSTQQSIKAYVDAEVASTQKLKENIENLTLNTEKIFNLTPRTFTWKNDSSVNRVERRGKQSFGYIAEEVRDVLPEIVGYDEENDPKSVDYKLLSVLLLEEVKKLKARVDLLEGG